MEIILTPNWSNSTWTKLNGTFTPYQITSSGELWLYSSVNINRGTKLRIKQGVSLVEGQVTSSQTSPFGYSIFVKKTSGFFTLGSITYIEESIAVPQKFYLDGAIDLELNLRVFDLKELKKSSPYTKTIEIPFTENNNKVFSQLYNINLTLGFNPKKKSDCIITDGGILISSGYLQVQDIDIPNKIYKCVFYGENKNLFDDLGDKFIWGNADRSKDIDLSRLTAPKWKTEIEAGWNGLRDVVWGLTSTETDVFTLNNMMDLGPFGGGGVQPSKWRPFIRAKAVFDSIFSKWGYQYESNFLESTSFTELFVLPSLKETPGESVLQWSVGPDGVPPSLTYSINNPGNTGANLVQLDTPINDPYGTSWDVLTSELIIPYTDSFNFNICVNFVPKSWVNAGEATEDGLFGKKDVIKVVPIVKRGGVEIWRDDQWHTVSGKAASKLISNRTTWGYYPISRIQVKSKGLNIDLKEGDRVSFLMRIVIGLTGPYTTTGDNTTNNPNFGQNFPEQTRDFISIENDRNLANIEPLFRGVRQDEFIGDIFKMFNLYIKPDKTNPRKFLIEPRDDFYKSGKTISDLEFDWNSANISYLTDLAAKKYIFTPTKGDDDFNKAFSEANRDRVWGDAIVELDNDFLTNEKKIQLSSVLTITKSIDSKNTINLPNLINAGKSNKLRFLYYNGKIETGLPLKYKFYSGETSTTTSTYTYYPGFSPFKQFLDPTSGGLLFSFTGSEGGRNLYTDYYENEIETYAEPNSHILTISVKLNSRIWSYIDYNDIYYFEVNGSPNYYTLLSIDGYNPDGTGMATMKFLSYFDFRGKKPLRLREVVSDTDVDTIIVNGEESDVKNISSGIIGGNGRSIVGGGSSVDNVIWAGSDIVISGDNKNVLAVGDNITIATGSNNVFLFGSNNVKVQDTATNLISFGGESLTFSSAETNQFRLNEYNLVLNVVASVDEITNPVDGMLVYEGSNVLKAYDSGVWNEISSTSPETPVYAYSIVSTDWTLLPANDTVEVDTGDVTITLPTAVSVNGKVYRVINSSTGVVSVVATASQTIGNSSTSLTYVHLMPEEWLDVISNNSNWRII